MLLGWWSVGWVSEFGWGGLWSFGLGPLAVLCFGGPHNARNQFFAAWARRIDLGLHYVDCFMSANFLRPCFPSGVCYLKCRNFNSHQLFLTQLFFLSPKLRHVSSECDAPYPICETVFGKGVCLPQTFCIAKVVLVSRKFGNHKNEKGSAYECGASFWGWRVLSKISGVHTAP